MKNLDGVLQSIDITLPTKTYTVKAMVFPVIMHSCESWTIKKAERQKLMPSNCEKKKKKKTVVLEKTLESPLDSKEIKKVNFKGDQP